MISWHQHWVKIRDFCLQASSKWNISVLKSYIISLELKIITGPYLASLQVLLSVRANFRGGRDVYTLCTPSPYQQLLCLPPPILRGFWKDFLTLIDMPFFEPSVMGGGGMTLPHHNFVVIAKIIMKFGTGVKLDVIYTMVTNEFVTSLLLHHYDAITCILA